MSSLFLNKKYKPLTPLTGILSSEFGSTKPSKGACMMSLIKRSRRNLAFCYLQNPFKDFRARPVIPFAVLPHLRSGSANGSSEALEADFIIF